MGTIVHKVQTIFGPLVHASGVHGGAEHSARRAKNIKNGNKWPNMRTVMAWANGAYVRLGLECALESVFSPMCPPYLLGVTQTPPDLGMAGWPSEPMICN